MFRNRFFRLAFTLFTTFILALVAGCKPNGNEPRFEFDIQPGIGFDKWPRQGGKSGRPGVDQASVFFIGKRFILWSDLEIYAKDWGRGKTLQGEGYLYHLRQQPIESGIPFTFKITADAGSFDICGRSYDLQKGPLILVTSGPDGPRVKQLNPNLSNVRIGGVGKLKEFGQGNSELIEFFASGERQPSE